MADGTTIIIEAQDTTFERNGLTSQAITRTPYDNGPNLQVVVGSGPIFSLPGFARNAVNGTNYLQELFATPDFETPTSGLYDRTLGVAYAMAQTGPTSVRGGTARVAFAIAESLTLAGLNRYREIYTAWLEWAKITVESVARYNEIFRAYDQQTLSYNEQNIMQQHASAQAAVGFLGQVNASNQALIQAYAAKLHYGNTTMNVQENLQGLGTQASSVSNGMGSANWR